MSAAERGGADEARVLSRAASEAWFHRILGWTTAVGETQITVRSDWAMTFGWGRNRPMGAWSTTRQRVQITRIVKGEEHETEVAGLDEPRVRAAVQALEQRVAQTVMSAPAPAAPGTPAPNTSAPSAPTSAVPGGPFEGPPPPLLGPQQYLAPPLWSEATARMTMHDLSELVRRNVGPVISEQKVTVGQAALSAASWAIFNTRGLAAYAAVTGALYRETVLSADGSAEGWAGGTHVEWAKLDASALAASALQQCRDGAAPRAIEPGRYTTILAPQAVDDLMFYFIEALDRQMAETDRTLFTLTPPHDGKLGVSKLGQPVIDRRLTIATDPMDPDCGYIPFDPEGIPYQPVTWVDRGILTALPYSRSYGSIVLRTEGALPNPRAYRMSGGDTSLDAMIASTDRGVLVTDLHSTREGTPLLCDPETLTLVGTTQGGIWLVEHGRIVRAITHFWFRIELMALLNRVLQIGPAVRVYGSTEVSGLQDDGTAFDYLPSQAVNAGHMPAVVPTLKVEDFNFTRLVDAV